MATVGGMLLKKLICFKHKYRQGVIIMIFADKLIQLRKKNGWSQEDLANQMNVSRQSVSKWEGAQSIPDFKRIIQLSELFGVTTDYLLKDEIEEVEPNTFKEDFLSLKRISMEEAFAYLHTKQITAKYIANAVFLCIISPICILILGAISEMPDYALSENIAGGIGMIVLLLFVALATAIFLFSGSKTSQYKYLEERAFETEYGVSQMVEKQKEQYKKTYTKNNIFAACMCIVSLVPLFTGVMINENNHLLLTIMLSFSFILAGIGVKFFISSGIVWASFERLLQEGDYTKQKKETKDFITSISTAYWLIAAAIYVGYSFITDNWMHSWIIWVIAGVLYPAIIAVVNTFGKPK